LYVDGALLRNEPMLYDFPTVVAWKVRRFDDESINIGQTVVDTNTFHVHFYKDAVHGT
jgi:hypothetical protein